MRLLYHLGGADFGLTEPLAHTNRPLYAIISHTWGLDSEEVTFQDIVNGTGKDKAGYEKLRFCSSQARRDGLIYFWIDTCYINKSNAVELSEAINSMFECYRNAIRCYVYLSDVPGTHGDWKLAFRASRWFTRGWTLQELLAPASVRFFALDHTLLGEKTYLQKDLSEITGIAISAFCGTKPLAQFDVEERFMWAKDRQTSREEDWAYCLLGIFGVFIPLIYGEGKRNAVRRLRKEINDILEDVITPTYQQSKPLLLSTLSSLTPF
ncbi:HET-domain-containing protein [Thozetella sp. PMI_491]|nr:HET-domain-containing protein [Thozetella sp. PMI_491]